MRNVGPATADMQPEPTEEGDATSFPMTAQRAASCVLSWWLAGCVGAEPGSSPPENGGDDEWGVDARIERPTRDASVDQARDTSAHYGTDLPSLDRAIAMEHPDLAGETRADAPSSPEAPPAAVGRAVVYVGDGEGFITPFDVTEAGALSRRMNGRIRVGRNPIFLSVWKGQRLYSVLDGEASLVALRLDSRTGGLDEIGRARGDVGGVGNVPAAIAVDGAGRFAVTGDYGGTTTLYPLTNDGKPERGKVMASGGNTHDVGIAQDRFVFSGSMAGKHINQYRYDSGARALVKNQPATVGDGRCSPRGMTVHPAGRLVLVMCHTPIVLQSWSVDPETGSLKKVGEAPALAAGVVAGGATGAEVQLHPGGRIAYGTVVDPGGPNNVIAVFSLDPDTGALSATSRVVAVGRTPRGIAVDPAGAFVYSASQSNATLAVFAIEGDGRLRFLAMAPTGASPIGVAAVRLAQ